MIRAAVLCFFAMSLLSACTSDSQRQLRALEQGVQTVDKSIKALEGHLAAGRIFNAKVLKSYAQALRAESPELAQLTEAMVIEATPQGALFQSLSVRLQELAATLPLLTNDLGKMRAATTTLNEIYVASQTQEFNRALADPVNVLADLSNGRLSRVDAVGEDAEVDSDGNLLAPGTQLVGNPHYGEWQQNSSGGSFWAWYGQYSMLRLLLGGRDYSYGGWATNRRYSYYHDYGRNHYTSPGQRQSARTTETRAKQKFAQSGKTFQSPYARQRSGASRRVSQARQAMRSPSASTRSRSSVSSRSRSGGK